MRSLHKLLVPFLVIAAAAGGMIVGQNGLGFGMLAHHAAMLFMDMPQKSTSVVPDTIVYFRHPDGLAEWSATPLKTSDGRDFIAVAAADEISFDPQRAVTTKERQILYYRNPMGLPDTSTVPKKDSMGMDYLPVYADDSSDDGAMTVTAGRLLRPLSVS